MPIEEQGLGREALDFGTEAEMDVLVAKQSLSHLVLSGLGPLVNSTISLSVFMQTSTISFAVSGYFLVRISLQSPVPKAGQCPYAFSTTEYLSSARKTSNRYNPMQARAIFMYINPWLPLLANALPLKHRPSHTQTAHCIAAFASSVLLLPMYPFCRVEEELPAPHPGQEHPPEANRVIGPRTETGCRI